MRSTIPADHKTTVQPSLSRRLFLRAGAGTAAALSAASYQRVKGANERVGLGFIGFGLIGKRHVLDFRAQADASLVALAEVHRGRLEEGAALCAATHGSTPTFELCSRIATSTRWSFRRPTTGTP